MFSWKYRMKIFTVLLLQQLIWKSDSYELLDRHLLYYEPLHYDTEDLHYRHLRATQNDVIPLHFQAFNKTFTLELKKASFSSSSIVLHHKQKSTTADFSFIYTGKHTGYSNSRIRVAIINGTLQGTVVLPGDTAYHIVPGTWLFGHLPPFHTVIYSEKDYFWNHTYPRETPEERELKTPETFRQRKDRLKRDLSGSTVRDSLKKRNICTLELTADHTLWRFFMNRNQNEDRTRYEILHLLDSHVAEANNIFGQTEITIKGKLDENKIKGLHFAIKTIKIMTEDDCNNAAGGYKSFCDEALDGNSLLETFTVDEDSLYDNEDYDMELEGVKHCLSFLFTARVLFNAKGSPHETFPLLGLAYPAAPGQKKAGGICWPMANTGFVTVLQGTDSVQVLSTHVTQLVFIHELAHSFGAVHDDQKECSDYIPDNEPDDGYYLMHSIAQKGDKPNHTKFSRCSLEFMAHTLLEEEYTECFIDEKNLSLCGNGIVDVGEECDCGQNCHHDNCCHPHNLSSNQGCSLKFGAQCSLSQGPCCNSKTCQFINQTDQFVCQNEQPCMKELYCHGETYGAQCPPPQDFQVKPDGFICSRDGRACHAGSCNASVCLLIGWRECQVFLDKEKLTISEKEDLCYIGCQKSRSTECISTNDLNKVHQYPELENLLRNISEHERTTKLPIQLPIGTPCNKNRGYCDVFRRCRGADPDSPLAKLRDCFVSGECMMQIFSFVKVYWWAVMIASLLGITFFWLFVKCCAVHTKSSNPEFEIRHPHRSVRQSVTSLEQTLRHPQRSIRESITGIRESYRRKSGRCYSREYSHSNEIIPEIESLSAEQDTELNDVFL